MLGTLVTASVASLGSVVRDISCLVEAVGGPRGFRLPDFTLAMKTSHANFVSCE